MNKESMNEGWLIKSPPTKRIWRARWRRRWFTLKQGEIPEQFCLEYYTDRNCRKLKGVIDLDQCEQVDCGLRLENRKQKFQFMFDIKTPKRTYYLAADTEADMRDWVNCICQVCHLHDTKQSNELLQDENRSQNAAHTNSTNNTTTTSLSCSSGPSLVSGSLGSTRQSFSSDLLRRPQAAVVDQQPLIGGSAANHSDSVYVNADYTNRSTLLCDMLFDRQQLYAAGTNNAMQAQVEAQTQAAEPTAAATQQLPSSPGAGLYLNSPVVFQAQMESAARVNANGVVRKIPDNLVLTPLPESQQHSVQPSPALSTSSGPYIPISECFSGSPKFALDGNNPTTPLNNLDPKFYDTPRSHNNIGLNLTNDQSYSPKITNCSLQQIASKIRHHRSDSDSESVFTDDDEWAHPMPLRENVDRSTRPSDSSIENESFVLTYSQRYSKFADEAAKEQEAAESKQHGKPTKDPLDKLAKVLKNKNNLILDFKEQEKMPRDIPQLSDTENTSPAIGPRDSNSVVEESYDIPRSHNLPYYNVEQLFEKVTSPEANPIAASTPNLMAGPASGGPASPAHVRTLPRPHCYTNAAPSKVEGNVFRYDFMEQGDLPPVNRKLKPKLNMEDKPPEEVPAKPPVSAKTTTATPQPMSAQAMEALVNKLMTANIQKAPSAEVATIRPPSVNRKLKPDAYKLGKVLLSSTARRSSGAQLSMVLSGNTENYLMEAHTLPRQPRLTNYAIGAHAASACATPTGNIIQHQRTASAVAAVTQPLPQTPTLMQLQSKNEHRLQYFDLDVANAPATINRQSMSVGNLNVPGVSRPGLSADPSARAPAKTGVVYNSVDFVKTEAFKRIREERKKESEGVSSSAK